MYLHSVMFMHRFGQNIKGVSPIKKFYFFSKKMVLFFDLVVKSGILSQIRNTKWDNSHAFINRRISTRSRWEEPRAYL